MHAICRVAIHGNTTGQQLKGLAGTLQRWLEDVPNSCRCSVAGDGIRYLRSGAFPTPECRQLNASLDDFDVDGDSIADPDRGGQGDSTGAVVIHIEYGSKRDYNEAIQSLRISLPSNLVADLAVMEMDWEDEGDD